MRTQTQEEEAQTEVIDFSTERRGRDRRKEIRFALKMPVCIQPEKGAVSKGVVLNCGENSLWVQNKTTPEKGTKVSIFSEYIGHISGRVVRSNEAGFAIEADFDSALMEKIVMAKSQGLQFRKLMDRRTEDVSRRREERIKVYDQYIIGTSSSFSHFKCSVTNISLSGIEMKTDVDLTIGEIVKVGKFVGTIVRRNGDTYGVASANSA